MIKRKSEVMGKLFVHMSFVLVSLACLIPFLIVLAISLSNEQAILEHGYSILPRSFTWTAYEYVFRNPTQILTSYKVTTIVTVFGTALSVMLMAMSAYCLARRNFRLRRQYMFFIFFTMLFSGGLVPSYILVSQYLNLRNTYWALILPGLINVFHIILLRTFFQTLPSALFESAKIDGANELVIFMRIAFPLSTPSLATVALLGALGRWNDWFNALLYITSDELLPLQYLLYRIMANLQFVAENLKNMPGAMFSGDLLPTETVRMAMCVVAAGPMMFVLPFFQKYFVKGLTVGSVKE